MGFYVAFQHKHTACCDQIQLPFIASLVVIFYIQIDTF
jgi:hypothetical protein